MTGHGLWKGAMVGCVAGHTIHKGQRYRAEQQRAQETRQVSRHPPVRRLTGDIRPAHLSSRHHSRPRGKPDGRKSKAPTDDEIAQTAESALPPKKPPAPSVKRRSRRSIKRGLA
jgi:hypothetical protein